MKTVDIDKATLDSCVDSAQEGRVVVMRDGTPVALVIGVEGLDDEQLELGANDRFWELIRQRRQERTLSRAALEEKLGSDQSAE